MTVNAGLARRVIDLALEIQSVPAPTFEEARRAAFVREQFQRAGLAEVEIDPTGNVYACLRGARKLPPLVVSAHLDTVFPTGTDLHAQIFPDRIAAPGIGDNSLGVAALFGLAWLLREQKQPPAGDVWLVANVGEEGLGDLYGMRAVVERFGSQPRAYIVVEGMGLGSIFHRGLGVRRYRIDARTEGGHSWIDYGSPSAIHELARLVCAISSLVLPADPRTSLNVGRISGGTSINTIAAHASLELDLRSEDPASLNWLIGEVTSLVARANRPGVEVTSEQIGNRPPGEIPENHPLVRLAADVLRELAVTPLPGIGSTDANMPLQRGIPAVCVGITHGSGAHTSAEFIYTQPVATGLDALYRLVKRAWE